MAVNWDQVLAAIGPAGLKALRAAGYDVVERDVACAVAAQQRRLQDARAAIRQGLHWLGEADRQATPPEGPRVRVVGCPYCQWEATVSVWADQPEAADAQVWVDWLWQRHVAQAHGRRKEG